MKPVCIVESDVKVKEIFDRMIATKDAANEQMGFIKKKADQIGKKLEDDLDTLWGELEEYCEESGLVKDAKNTDMAFNNGVLVAGGKKGEDCGHAECELGDGIPIPIKALMKLFGKKPDDLN